MSSRFVLSNIESRRPILFWRSIVIILNLVCIYGLWFAAFAATSATFKYLNPDQVFFCTRTDLSFALQMMCCFALVAPIGLILAKLILLPVRQAQIALSSSKDGHGMFLLEACLMHLKFFLMSLAVVLPVYLLSFFPRICLSNTQIYYRPHFFSPLTAYDLSMIALEEPECTRSNKGGWRAQQFVEMTDGTRLQLTGDYAWYRPVHERILHLLSHTRSDYTNVDPGCPWSVEQFVAP